jgi:transcriptional regulator with XRE-family HTH domain
MDSKHPWAAAQDPIYYRFLGRAIRVLRAERGLERKELAARCGISYPYLSEIESGKKRPSSQALRAIAEALGVPPHELLATAEALARRGDAETRRYGEAETRGQAEARGRGGAETWGAEDPAFPRPPSRSRFFHEATPLGPAVAEESEVIGASMFPAAPAAAPPSGTRRRLEAALAELRYRLERMAAEDVERILDLARRLSR